MRVKDNRIQNALVIGLTLTLGAVAIQIAAAQSPAPLLQEESPTATPLGQDALTQLLFEAEANNPGLQAAYHGWQAALARVPQAVSLMDPEVTFTEFLEKNRDTHAEDFELEVMQIFPYPGKLSLRGKSAADEARAMEQELIERRLEVRRELKDAYYEYYYLEQSIRITSENLDLLKHFERVANSRYEVNRAGNQDVIKAQVELGELENELRTLEDFRGPVQARLNAALNRPALSPVRPPETIDLQAVELETEEVLEWAFRANPMLRGIDARIDQQQAELELAKKDYYPDFGLGLEWDRTHDRFDSGPEGVGGDVLMGRVKFNLPIYRDRLAAGVREAEQDLQEQQNLKAEARNQLGVELQTALYKLRDAKRQIDLYSNILIPKAQQSVTVTQTAYSAEEAGFLDLIDTERVLLNFQNSYYRAVSNYGQALALIEAKVGQSVVSGDAGQMEVRGEEAGGSGE